MISRLDVVSKLRHIVVNGQIIHLGQINPINFCFVEVL